MRFMYKNMCGQFRHFPAEHWSLAPSHKFWIWTSLVSPESEQCLLDPCHWFSMAARAVSSFRSRHGPLFSEEQHFIYHVTDSCISLPLRLTHHLFFFFFAFIHHSPIHSLVMLPLWSTTHRPTNHMNRQRLSVSVPLYFASMKCSSVSSIFFVCVFWFSTMHTEPFLSMMTTQYLSQSAKGPSSLNSGW